MTDETPPPQVGEVKIPLTVFLSPEDDARLKGCITLAILLGYVKKHTEGETRLDYLVFALNCAAQFLDMKSRE